VRTIEGLKRLDAIVARLDADFADPLELTASSRIGVPGWSRPCASAPLRSPTASVALVEAHQARFMRLWPGA